MADSRATRLPALVAENQQEILQSWIEQQRQAGALGSGRLNEGELREQSERFLDQVRGALSAGAGADIEREPWREVRELLGEVSRSRAVQGFTPSQTATFVFSLKQPLFSLLRTHITDVRELA